MTTREEWLRFGYDHGFCGAEICATHDGIPMSVEEEEDDEPCIWVVRLYPDAEFQIGRAHV